MARLGWAWAARWEAPTWGLACLIYGGWLCLTCSWHNLPIWIAAPLGAWLCAWQMSLQHELIHGHPTRSPRLNAWLAGPPLNLWLPYELYREAHLRHHAAHHLTDPREDPESTYASPEAWAQASPMHRWLRRACTTAIGRMLLGPPCAASEFWAEQASQAAPLRGTWRIWLGHAFAIFLVIFWLRDACHIDLATYAAFVAYPATALIMLRSLAEHRAAPHAADRTAVVENAGLLGLLFLNNNLHLLHHERPAIAWYALPTEWRRVRADRLATWRGPLYRGYAEIWRRYAWHPHHPGPHPGATLQPDGAPESAADAVAAPAC